MIGSPATEAGRYDDEGPQREVTLGQPFVVGKAEVTRGQFRDFVRASGWKPSVGCRFYDGKEWKLDEAKNWENPGYVQDDEHPVVCVNHEDAQQYVKWLSRETKQAYRLLTEEEWEYAARAGTTTSRYWGNSEAEACAYANVADRTGTQKYRKGRESPFDCTDGYAETAPVSKFKANGFGLYDMLGNVWEWVEDCHSAGYDKARECSGRVARGGGWGTSRQTVRSAYRYRVEPSEHLYYLGFRLARTLP